MDENFEKEIFEQRYSLIKKKEIRDAIDRYKAENKDDAKFLVLKSNVREDTKAKSLYSTAKAFSNWKDAENYASTVTHSIIVDTDKKTEVNKINETQPD